jgi:hypothetical protein
MQRRLEGVGDMSLSSVERLASDGWTVAGGRSSSSDDEGREVATIVPDRMTDELVTSSSINFFARTSTNQSLYSS